MEEKLKKSLEAYRATVKKMGSEKHQQLLEQIDQMDVSDNKMLAVDYFNQFQEEYAFIHLQNNEEKIDINSFTQKSPINIDDFPESSWYLRSIELNLNFTDIQITSPSGIHYEEYSGASRSTAKAA